MRLGPGDIVEFQVARCTAPLDVGDPGRTELEVLVAEIRRAMTLDDIVAPHRPWLPPLPVEIRNVDEPPRSVRRGRAPAPYAAAVGPDARELGVVRCVGFRDHDRAADDRDRRGER